MIEKKYGFVPVLGGYTTDGLHWNSKIIHYPNDITSLAEKAKDIRYKYYIDCGERIVAGQKSHSWLCAK